MSVFWSTTLSPADNGYSQDSSTSSKIKKYYFTCFVTNTLFNFSSIWCLSVFWLDSSPIYSLPTEQLLNHYSWMEITSVQEVCIDKKITPVIN